MVGHHLPALDLIYRFNSVGNDFARPSYRFHNEITCNTGISGIGCIAAK